MAKNIDELEEIQSIKETAKKALEIEVDALKRMEDSINNQFVDIVKIILDCKGRIVLTGMGKSGFIAKKLSATFSSTGTPSFFLHPTEAIHGDLGMVTSKDIVIALSNSGESEEIINILPHLKRIGAKIIAMTGNRNSNLAKSANYLLETKVEKEACPLNLAPTASTTAMLGLGDALAVALIKLKDFKPEDFAVYHPGGSLGKKLLFKVEDVLKIKDKNLVMHLNSILKECLFEMIANEMGAVSIINDEGKLIGIVTDGDIKRKLKNSVYILNEKVSNIMINNPITISQDKLATEALNIMKEKEINYLPVINSSNKPIGMINFQDLLKAGVL